MIPFAEKLSFLMRITGASNKELAAELGVDPSMVSLLRTGKRKLSKNPAHVKKMARYFALHASAAFQRQALSEMLGQAAISPGMPVDTLAGSLERWLQGDESLADTVLSGLNTPPSRDEYAPAPPPAPIPPTQAGQTLFFYGVEGRRESMRHLMRSCREMEVPTSILTVVDDNLEWLLSDYSLSKQVQSWLLESAEQGFDFCQIMPPMNYINRYAESLHFWLPLYATGKTKVYYYPRLRGNLYRHSIVVVPGRCVQYVSSISTSSSTSDITMFSADPQLVRAFETQFREHLSLCRPSLTVHRDPAKAYPCCQDYFHQEGESVQLINSLSLCTLPRELLERYAREADSLQWQGTFRLYLDDLPNFERRLETLPFLDMCRLFTAEEIRSGTVPVGSSSQDDCGQPWYTPETYCLHLKNILRLMDTYENYFFLPIREKEYPHYDLFTNENCLALIVCTAQPPMTLEIRRQPMVAAFREHLLRRAEAAGYDGIERAKIRLELRSLIQSLGG